MSVGFWISELLREGRYLFNPPTSCPGAPWGAIALVVLLAFCLGCCCGGLAALVALSAGCRSALLVLLRLLTSQLQTTATGFTTQSLQHRLSEYQRRQ